MSCCCYHISDMQVTFPAFPSPRLSVLLSLNSEQAGGLGWQEPAGTQLPVFSCCFVFCNSGQRRAAAVV